jgi:hypothetical protein
VTDRFGIEGDSAQALIESLHKTGWITYPRVSADPVTPTKISFQEGRTFEQFSGTAQERHILQVINDSELAETQGIPYLSVGAWVLNLDTTIDDQPSELDLVQEKVDLTKNLAILKEKMEGTNKVVYTDDQFDIDINRDGRKPDELLNLMIEEEIGTPATRTQLLTRLKSAGVISLRNGRYRLDRRGIYFVAFYNYLHPKAPEEIEVDVGEPAPVDTTEEPERTVKARNKELFALDDPNLDNKAFLQQLQQIVRGFKGIKGSPEITGSIKDEIRKEVKRLMEVEEDLARLESF